ncbi:toprim domain-containing protein [Treponema sp.]|uniref:toprim domain-containing protein n=1 Tax=Treponema sp. TaxID=166 RepID=UPI00298EBFBD|nr:toprim domain-containing protein [Treponema sp.]MCR5614493.1 type IIA DNA topoisomerase subunit B [Treponema sp.]
MGGKISKTTAAKSAAVSKAKSASKTQTKSAATKTASKTSKTAASKTATSAKTASKAAPSKSASASKTTAAKTVASKTVSKPAPVSKPAATAQTAPKTAAKPSSKTYDESQIKHLDALEHIRLRSGMYIGRLGDGSNQNDGIYVLLKEVIDNSIDEYIMGYGKKIDVQVKDNTVKVRDYGRGIPLGKVVDCVSEINTGAKYNDDVFQFSVGMNGVGTKAVNALSSHFRVISIRDGECCEAVFEKGKLKTQRTGKLKEKQPNGTYFEFTPDVDIFGKYNYNMEFVEKRMWNYAYLNEGLTIRFNGQDYHSDNGLFDLLNNEIEDTSLYPIGSYVGEHLRFAFTHTNGYGENHFSFVNGQYTTDGGTHLNAFKEGFVKGINDFYGTSYKAEDVREGMAAAVLVKVKDPVFESQTKNKLGNTDVRAWIVPEVQSGLNDWLHRNPDAAKKIEEKIKANEKLRTELSAVKKEAKEAAKKISIRIKKLKDCQFHVQDGKKGENSMIFITEGDSATGTMTHSRNANFQAIFSLRGKPENMCGKKQSEIYKNDELYQLMMALGIETDVENLRYEKIIIATDADNDGYHIRNLVMTFFLGYFEELVTSGRVFILETPLFRVRNKKENIYCYSEEERDKAQAKLGRGAETTRFKGLGEINPSEFKQFIDPETMHLTPVEISQLKLVPQLLNFYMGKNTPERRAFIEKHLLSNADIDA